jgi:hypothetical protein
LSGVYPELVEGGAYIFQKNYIEFIFKGLFIFIVQPSLKLWRTAFAFASNRFLFIYINHLKKMAVPAEALAKAGGERGIRTLAPGFPDSCLAGKRFRPLSHLSLYPMLHCISHEDPN